MTALPSVGPPQMAERNLSARLDALAELLSIGRLREGPDQARQGQANQGQDLASEPADGFSRSLLDDSDAVLRRAGERLRLSANHTVVALAGSAGHGASAGSLGSPSMATSVTRLSGSAVPVPPARFDPFWLCMSRIS